MGEGVVLEECQPVNLVWGKSYALTALLKTYPFNGSHQCCEAACVVVVIGDKSSIVGLNSFQLSYVDVHMWVPNSCCIFQLGPDKCLVASFLDMLRTGRQILAEKISCIIGLLCHCVHMSIRRKIVADQDYEVLCILGVSEIFAMEGVVCINRLTLLGDPN